MEGALKMGDCGQNNSRKGCVDTIPGRPDSENCEVAKCRKEGNEIFLLDTCPKQLMF